MIPVPEVGQPLALFGGQIDIRVEIDSGLEGETFGIWEVSEWDVETWGSEDASWFDLTPWVSQVVIHAGAERWGQRFQTGTATITVDNTTGIFTPDSGVATPFLLPFTPGRRVRVVAIPDPDTGTKVPQFSGILDDSRDSFAGEGFDIDAVLSCVDNMGLWAGYDPPALDTPTGVQTTHDRVEAALDRMGWPAGDRDIQTGAHTMMTSHLAQTILEECAEAADAEGGAFFAAKTGEAVFKARDWLITDTRSIVPQGFIGYEEVEAGEQSAWMIQPVTSWERGRIANQIQFARVGSTVQLAEDETSQDTFGLASYERMDFQNNDDAEVLWLAERYLAIRKDLRLRVDAVSLAANEDPDNDDLNRIFWATELGDLISVRIETPYGWGIERLAQVMGWTHTITKDDWQLTLKLDDALINFLPES
jgi:hypothetical protein